MVWLQLFKKQSLEQGMKRKCISGVGLSSNERAWGIKDRLKLRWAFNMCNLPFYFRKQSIISNPNSPFHKLPKGILKKEKKYIYKLSQLREGITQALEKTEKFRQERYNKKKLTGLDKQMVDAQIFLAGKNVASITETLSDSEIIQRMMDNENRRDKKKNVSIHTKGIKSTIDTSRLHREKLKFFTEVGYLGNSKQPEFEENSKKNKKAQSEMNMSMKEYKQIKKEKENI